MSIKEEIKKDKNLKNILIIFGLWLLATNVPSTSTNALMSVGFTEIINPSNWCGGVWGVCEEGQITGDQNYCEQVGLQAKQEDLAIWKDSILDKIGIDLAKDVAYRCEKAPFCVEFITDLGFSCKQSAYITIGGGVLIGVLMLL